MWGHPLRIISYRIHKNQVPIKDDMQNPKHRIGQIRGYNPSYTNNLQIKIFGVFYKVATIILFL